MKTAWRLVHARVDHRLTKAFPRAFLEEFAIQSECGAVNGMRTVYKSSAIRNPFLRLCIFVRMSQRDYNMGRV